MNAAMRLQSANALGQAGLLIGANGIVRVDAPGNLGAIHMDDWVSAVAQLPGAATTALEVFGPAVESLFLTSPAVPYRPVIIEGSDAQEASME